MVHSHIASPFLTKNKLHFSNNSISTLSYNQLAYLRRGLVSITGWEGDVFARSHIFVIELSCYIVANML